MVRGLLARILGLSGKRQHNESSRQFETLQEITNLAKEERTQILEIVSMLKRKEMPGETFYRLIDIAKEKEKKIRESGITELKPVHDEVLFIIRSMETYIEAVNKNLYSTGTQLVQQFNYTVIKKFNDFVRNYRSTLQRLDIKTDLKELPPMRF